MSNRLSGVHRRLRAHAWRLGLLWGVSLASVGPLVFWLAGIGGLSLGIRLASSTLLSLGLIVWYAHFQASRLIQPFVTLRAGLVHLAPGTSDTTPPSPNEPQFAREATLEILDGVYSLYKYATQVAGVTGWQDRRVGQLNTLLDKLPVPLLVLTGKLEILHANTNALALLDTTMSKIEGRTVDETMPLRLNGQLLLPSWLDGALRSGIPDNVVWRGVTFNSPHQRYWFDVYAHYSPGDATDPQVVLFLIDKTQENRLYQNPKADRKVIDIVK